MSGRVVAIPSRGVSFFVREEGQGFPLLMMHGGPGADHSTLLSLRPLARKYRLIFYDHRCNGRSTRADLATFEWETLAADADAIRQLLGIDKCAVVGHSFGGMVALEYAIRYPHNVTHLALLDTGANSVWVRQNASLELERRGFNRLVVETATRFYYGQIARSKFVKSMAILGRAYYSRPSMSLMVKEALHGLRTRANPETCIYGFRELLSGWSAMNRLNQIKARTLIVAGIDDFQFPPEHQQELQKGIAGARLQLISGAGHNAHNEQPRKMVAILNDFLENG
jgi:proline-specific peptidase